MLDFLPALDRVVAMRVTGRVDEHDIERGIQAIEAALARNERISLLVEIEMAGMTAGAFTRDLSYSLGKLRDLHRFSRVAVVTSQDWLKALARVQDRILPHVEVRAFTPPEREEAMAWVSQPAKALEMHTEPPGPAVRLIETTRPDVIAFEVNGKISSDDMHRLVSAFDESLRAHERLRVLVRVLDFDGVSLGALRNEALWSVKMRGLKQVERYALVGGPDWMETVARWSAPLVRVETQHFSLDEEQRAWDWLAAQPR
jgi:hypothetical protein